MNVPADDCPLSPAEQTRNLLVFAANTGLMYLAAPILYVGMTQAALFKELQATNATSNLPASMVMWLTPLPVLLAWYLPYVRMLKPVIVCGFVAHSAAAAVVVVALLLPSSEWVIRAVLLHAAVVGVANGAIATFQWEVLGRGVSQSRRGKAFALAFGAGPILAVAGSLGSQMVLDGKLLPGLVELAPGLAETGSMRNYVSQLGFRWNFALLFAAGVPITAAAALLSNCFVIPQPRVEVERQPFVSGVFGGLREFFGYRVIRIAIVAYVLVYAGYLIMPTITLYTEQVTGRAAQEFVGYQNALRFGFKVAAGFVLGWLLTRFSPKSGPLATAVLCFAGVVWALVAPGQWFLLSFGLMGAGELFDAYFRNYILCCSAKSRMRRNIAFVSMLGLPIGVAPYLFGRISDYFRPVGMEMVGFQMSFRTALAMLAAGLVIILLFLPPRPRPRESDMDVSDRALQA